MVMSRSRQSLQVAALVAAWFLVSSSAVFAAGEEHSHEHAAGGAKLVLDHGKKWRTDAVARRSMEKLRTALSADLNAIHAGTETDAQYQALAERVNSEVANMVQNCKLEPRVDEQFHVVLTELLAAAEAMQGKDKDASTRHGAERMAKALNDYGRYFQHPGWKRL
jgi:hypothetical protein